ncbi:hypothetical protein [Sphingomonas nostoxanthinifaciens]|uniref:hypothetical protein n=1 Tax=Sphingomonas nostoxanthinifaciens TaxID=2872652 RepID=UPI001CC21620|nr:hypothetical protein [Sphingomonas nostoxanthinifaciens]UAK24204.1 hypothetical protein K8P63_18035 [Sphingomonas nostoxanthinifaciens]UAK24367.1 hypothetical protein K8P63_18975 [Sphingomonas nostoxanthinifaciens]
MGRPRKYDFGQLEVGDRLVVALNGRQPYLAQASVSNAAAHYARTKASDFAFTTSTSLIRGFVVLERVAFPGDQPLHLAADRNRVAQIEQSSRQRELTSTEIDRFKRQLSRIERRAA